MSEKQSLASKTGFMCRAFDESLMMHEYSPSSDLMVFKMINCRMRSSLSFLFLILVSLIVFPSFNQTNLENFELPTKHSGLKESPTSISNCSGEDAGEGAAQAKFKTKEDREEDVKEKQSLKLRKRIRSMFV